MSTSFFITIFLLPFAVTGVLSAIIAQFPGKHFALITTAVVYIVATVIFPLVYGVKYLSQNNLNDQIVSLFLIVLFSRSLELGALKIGKSFLSQWNHEITKS